MKIPYGWMRTFFLLLLCALVNADTRRDEIIEMQKSIYSVLGQLDVPEIASRFRPRFIELDLDGTLGNTLDSLYEMRLIDLQTSIQHASKMRSVLDALERSVSSET